MLQFSWLGIQRLVIDIVDESWPVCHWMSYLSFILPTCPLYPLDICMVYMVSICVVWWRKKEEFWWDRREEMRKDMRNREEWTSLPSFWPQGEVICAPRGQAFPKMWKSCFCIRIRVQTLFFCASYGKTGHRVWRRTFFSFLAEDIIEN